mmetsp:Transcript_30089/g.36751  ORF Transcript_30089/g.36751 Transcript_30089/m.36751 type:complete len:147 (+) Transcript_30089:92-532(+)
MEHSQSKNTRNRHSPSVQNRLLEVITRRRRKPKKMEEWERQLLQEIIITHRDISIDDNNISSAVGTVVPTPAARTEGMSARNNVVSHGTPLGMEGCLCCSDVNDGACGADVDLSVPGAFARNNNRGSSQRRASRRRARPGYMNGRA